MATTRFPRRVERAVVLAGWGVGLAALAVGGVAAGRGALAWGGLFAWSAIFSGLMIAVYGFAPARAASWALGLAVLNIAFVIPEWALRVAGFRHESGVQFGFPRPEQFDRFVRDESLFWTLDPAAEGVNSRGFPGAEWSERKPPGEFRILYLGDSCTYEKEHVVSYPSLVHELREVRGRAGGDYISLAVPGYSTHQGRILAERYGAALEPDVAVVFFGWNDHWLAYGEIDSEKALGVGPVAQLTDWVHGHSRLVQWVSYGVAQAAEGLREEPAGPRRLRVPLPEFERNLRAIVAAFRRADVPVIVVTAPSAHAALGVPRYVVERGFSVDAETALVDHARYAAAARAVAESEGAWLLDLERDFGAVPPERLRRYFRVDGIHLSLLGAVEVALRVDAVVEERSPR